MYSCWSDTVLPVPGCPIRKSPDQSLLSGSPKLIAASHALHRLLAPRHSPCALNSLTKMQEHPCACTRRLPVHTLFSCQRTLEAKATRKPPKLASLEALNKAPRRANSSIIINGADGDRTHDLRLAKPALSQLSYSPGGGGIGGTVYYAGRRSCWLRSTSGCPGDFPLYGLAPPTDMLGSGKGSL